MDLLAKNVFINDYGFPVLFLRLSIYNTYTHVIQTAKYTCRAMIYRHVNNNCFGDAFVFFPLQ